MKILSKLKQLFGQVAVLNDKANHFFEGISIRGRYIYGYICLLVAIEATNTEPLPAELDALLKEFVSSRQLDDWLEKMTRVLPPTDPLFVANDMPLPDVAATTIQAAKSYYSTIPKPIVNIIDYLIWIGIANIYSGYRSEDSMKYLDALLETMKDNGFELPDFQIVGDCSVNEFDGWGNETDMAIYVKRYRPESNTSQFEPASFIIKCRELYFKGITPSNPQHYQSKKYQELAQIAKSNIKTKGEDSFAGHFQEYQYLIDLWAAHFIYQFYSPQSAYQPKAIEIIQGYAEGSLNNQVSIEEKAWLEQNLSGPTKQRPLAN